MKHVVLSAVVISFIACTSNPTAINEDVEEVKVETKEVPVLSMANFDIEAANYIDGEIQISGIVDHVCKHGGKKLLLVNDDGDVHVEADSRFEDELVGQHVSVQGIVREFRVDEGYCLKMEEDNISSHKEGETNQEDFEHKQNMVQTYRDSMEVAGIDHLSYYSLDFVSFVEDGAE